ncbi:MAG: cyanophycin synthetase, partial [Pseudomonadota bacterium]
DVWGERVVDATGDAGAFHIYVDDHRLVCRPPFGGEHRWLTLTAVFAALSALDADLDRAAQDVFRLTVPTGRGQVVNAGSWTLVDDSYNANPVSMGYAVDALHEEKGHRVALLGEMLELGSTGPSAHESVLSEAIGKLDQVVTVGEAWPQVGQDLRIEQLEDASLSRFIDFIEEAAGGKTITALIKGANKVFWANGFVDRLKTALIERQTRT